MAGNVSSNRLRRGRVTRRNLFRVHRLVLFTSLSSHAFIIPALGDGGGGGFSGVGGRGGACCVTSGSDGSVQGQSRTKRNQFKPALRPAALPRRTRHRRR